MISWFCVGLLVGRLWIGDELVEIDLVVLCFDIDEVVVLLNDVGGL